MSHACVGMPGLRCVSDGHGTRTVSCNDEGLFRFLVGLAAWITLQRPERDRQGCLSHRCFYFPALPGQKFSRRPSVDLPAAVRLRFLLVSAECAGHADQRSGDRGLGRLLDQRHAVVAHLDHRAVVVGQPQEESRPTVSCLLERDLAVVQARPIDHVFTCAKLSICEKDIMSRTTFRRQGRSSWVISKTWLAISRAIRSMAV